MQHRRGRTDVGGHGGFDSDPRVGQGFLLVGQDTGRHHYDVQVALGEGALDQPLMCIGGGGLEVDNVDLRHAESPDPPCHLSPPWRRAGG